MDADQKDLAYFLLASSVRCNIRMTMRIHDVASPEDYVRCGWADHSEAVQAHEDTARELAIEEHGRDSELLADWPATWREIVARA